MQILDLAGICAWHYWNEASFRGLEGKQKSTAQNPAAQQVFAPQWTIEEHTCNSKADSGQLGAAIC